MHLTLRAAALSVLVALAAQAADAQLEAPAPEPSAEFEEKTGDALYWPAPLAQPVDAEMLCSRQSLTNFTASNPDCVEQLVKGKAGEHVGRCHAGRL